MFSVATQLLCSPFKYCTIYVQNIYIVDFNVRPVQIKDLNSTFFFFFFLHKYIFEDVSSLPALSGPLWPPGALQVPCTWGRATSKVCSWPKIVIKIIFYLLNFFSNFVPVFFSFRGHAFLNIDSLLANKLLSFLGSLVGKGDLRTGLRVAHVMPVERW